MRSPQPFLVILVVTALLTTGLPSATWADNDDKDKAKIRGVIVALNPDGSFQVQEYGERAPRWHVILQRGGEIEDDDDDDDKRARRLRWVTSSKSKDGCSAVALCWRRRSSSWLTRPIQ